MINNTVMGFMIVALIGYFIAFNNTEDTCFTWCDVGKTLLLWGLTELAVFAVKGGVMKVKPVGVFGGEGYMGEEPDARGIGNLVGTLQGDNVYGGDSASVASNVVRK